MQRREALSRVALLIGGTIIGADAFLTGCKTNGRTEGVFSADDVAFLDEVADTILPTTAASPGAKAAQTGAFMKTFVTDCYEPEDQKIFIDGIGKINDAANKKFSDDFMKLTADQKLQLLNELDKTAKAESDKTKTYWDGMTEAQNSAEVLERNFTGKDPHAAKYRENPTYYFSLMKQLTLLGYFTSKLASNTALRYEAVPGKFDGNYPYKKGDKAWATS